jgi:1,4-alpha-glucan branching enzyme
MKRLVRTGTSIVAVIWLVLIGASCGRLLERRVASPVVDGETVVFRLKNPSARTVQVAGDWQGNNWARGDAEGGEILVGRMEADEEGGVWELVVHLEPGRYRYRFLVNESVWILDPDNPRVVDDGRGGKANLLIVP